MTVIQSDAETLLRKAWDAQHDDPRVQQLSRQSLAAHASQYPNLREVVAELQERDAEAARPPALPDLNTWLIATAKAGLEFRRMSQSTLAQETNLSEKHVSQVLTGHATATTATWDLLLRTIYGLDKYGRMSRCPRCGHMPHFNICFNMASDNDCSCPGQPKMDVASTRLYPIILGD